VSRRNPIIDRATGHTASHHAPGEHAQLLVGRVMHERLRPAHHAFVYPLFQVCCDVGKLETLSRWWFGVDRWRLLSIASRDFAGRDGRSLEAWMRERLAEEGIPADGTIWLQCIPRMAGYAFNPVSFWYCNDRQGQLRALYADVRNTFGQHHGYLLSAADHIPIDRNTALITRKTFHVSPFCDVRGHYAFRIQRDAEKSSVAIDYSDDEGLLLRTLISMQVQPLNGVTATRVLLAQPLNAIKVVVRIHWQALRLWLKHVPFYGKTPPTQSEHDTDSTHRTGHKMPIESHATQRDHEVRP
jgi:DUF1365 family protein